VDYFQFRFAGYTIEMAGGLTNVCVCAHVLAIWAKYAQKLLSDYT